MVPVGKSSMSFPKTESCESSSSLLSSNSNPETSLKVCPHNGTWDCTVHSLDMDMFVDFVDFGSEQARKLGRCDSYLQSETINDSLTHSLTH